VSHERRAFDHLPAAIPRVPSSDRVLPERLGSCWVEQTSVRRNPNGPLPELWPDFGPLLDLLGL
jgi:hypothetical protein